MNNEIFISYRRKNSEEASFIYDGLVERGHRAFFDTHSLLVGDFTDEIEIAIQECELVVALLTDESVQRMVKEPGDMVRKELETARASKKPIFFIWLNCERSELYQKFVDYTDDEFVSWISRQNIIPTNFDSESRKNVMAQIVEALETELRRKFEAIRQSPKRELHKEIAYNNKAYEYHGQSRLGGFGERVPYQEGILENKAGVGIVTSFEGTWDGDVNFSGHGSVYKENLRTGKRWRVYQGNWCKLKYHDNDGCIYNEEGKRIYRGCFVDGEKSLYGEEIFEDGSTFKGWYKQDKPTSGERRYANGDVYSGTFKDDQPDGFGRMIYADGRTYAGDFDNGQFSGTGTLTYSKNSAEIIYSGSFRDGRKTGVRKDEPMEVRIKAPGEKEANVVYRSVDSGFYESCFQGTGTFFYEDGSVYEGSWSAGTKARGIVYKGAQEIPIERGLPANQKMTEDLYDWILKMLDEEWAVQKLLLEDNSDAHLLLLYTFSSIHKWGVVKGVLATLREEVSEKLHIKTSKEAVPDYPYEGTFIQRLAAFSELKPSLRIQLPEDEQRSMERFVFDRKENVDNKVVDISGIDFSRLTEQAENGLALEQEESTLKISKLRPGDEGFSWEDFFGQ